MTDVKEYGFDSAMWDPEGPPQRASSPGYDGLRYRSYLWHEYDKDGSKNDPVRYRFLGDPDSEEANKAGLWVFIPHQVGVREGRQSLLEGVPVLPAGVSSVPLRGTADDLLDKVMPGRWNTDSQTKQVKTNAAVIGLFADDEDQLQILELTARQWRQLCERLREWREDFEDPTWSLVGRAVTIQKEGVKGTPGASNVLIRTVKGVKPTPLDQMPEGYDLRDHLAEIRAAVDKALGVEPTGKPAHKAVRTIEPEATATGDPAGEVKLTGLDNDELKALLDKAGVEYPAKARRAVLLQRAVDAGLGETGADHDDVPF